MIVFDGVGLALAVAGSAALLGLTLVCLWWLDRCDREPLHLVLAAFPVGGLVLLLTALSADCGLLPSVELGPGGAAVGTLALQEAAKAAVVLLFLVLGRGFDTPVNGVILGASVGLGSAVAVVLSGGSPGIAGGEQAPVAVQSIASILGTVGTQAAATALFGGCAGHAAVCGRVTGRVLWIGLGLGLAFLTRGVSAGLQQWVRLSDGGASAPKLIAFVGLTFVLYLGVIVMAVLSERRILLRQLEEEVGYGVVPAWVAEIIPSYRRRIRSDWWPQRRERTVIARSLSRLAFRKHALRHLPAVDKELAGLEVVRLRQDIRRILGNGDGRGTDHQ